jgi:GrpB-like predicted nucleotidyltransferase (UPF0157 family)
VPNWKDPTDYNFTSQLTREGWVWEFLRRNPQYRAAYAAVDEKHKKASERSGKKPGMGGRPLFAAQRILGRNWRFAGDAQSPADDAVPDFRIDVPAMPSASEVQLYFETPDAIGQARQLPGYAVLVYNLWGDLDEQHGFASHLLRVRQREEGYERRKRNLNRKQLATYLRLLDAKSNGADTKAILDHIAAYASVVDKTGAEHGFQAQKRIARDLKQANALVDDPWSLLR